MSDERTPDARLRALWRIAAAARDLYSVAVGEHGHDETHSADWPSCLPAHIAMNRYRDALAKAEDAETVTATPMTGKLHSHSSDPEYPYPTVSEGATAPEMRLDPLWHTHEFADPEHPSVFHERLEFDDGLPPAEGTDFEYRPVFVGRTCQGCE